MGVSTLLEILDLYTREWQYAPGYVSTLLEILVFSTAAALWTYAWSVSTLLEILASCIAWL